MVPFFILVALVLGGCAKEPEQVGFALVDTTTCDVMSPHMPQRVQRADTYQSKVEALHRNQAWQIACPGPRVASQAEMARSARPPASAATKESQHREHSH